MVVYAIPSYNRPDGIYKKTLMLLKKYDIPSKDIYIFLHTNEEKELYTFFFSFSGSCFDSVIKKSRAIFNSF